MNTSNLTSCLVEPVSNCAGAVFGSYGLLLTGIITGVISIGILSCTQQRTHSKYCGGYIGIPVPLDMLTVTKHRLVYTLVFGAMADTVLSAFTFSVPFPGFSRVVSSIFGILVKILLISLLIPLYYPMLAGVQAPIPLLGYFIGLLQTSIVFIAILLLHYTQFGGCLGDCPLEGVQLAISILSTLFIFACLLLIIVWYVFSIFREIYKIVLHSKSLRDSSDASRFVANFHFKRVKLLLRRNPTFTKRQRIAKTVYSYDPGFRYPVRFTIAMIISSYILYRLYLLALSSAIRASVLLGDLRNDLLLINPVHFATQFQNATANTSIAGIVNVSVTLVTIVQDIAQGGLLGVAVVLPLGPTLSTVLCLVSIFLTFRNVSDHLHKAARNDLSFLPKALPSNERKLTAAIKFPGFQAAYLFWAWGIYSAIFIIGLLAVVAFCVLIKYLYSYILDYGFGFVVVFLYGQAILFAEFLIAKFVFIVREEWAKDTLVINNRRLYHCFAFVWLFLNIFVGIFAAILRILMTAIFSLLLVMRMDRNVLMKGFEKFDIAHKTYIGFIYLEYIQNHSVMNAFVLLLEQSLRKTEPLTEDVLPSVPTSEDSSSAQNQNRYVLFSDAEKSINTTTVPRRAHVSQRAFNRWMVAYTLLNNESLIKMRGNYLKAVDKDDAKLNSESVE